MVALLPSVVTLICLVCYIIPYRGTEVDILYSTCIFSPPIGTFALKSEFYKLDLVRYVAKWYCLWLPGLSWLDQMSFVSWESFIYEESDMETFISYYLLAHYCMSNSLLSTICFKGSVNFVCPHLIFFLILWGSDFTLGTEYD